MKKIMNEMKLGRWVHFLVISAVFLFVPLSALWAQTSVSGTINGILTDPSGAVIPGVKVTATNTGTQQSATAATNNSGYFVVPNLPAGIYDVKIGEGRIRDLPKPGGAP